MKLSILILFSIGNIFSSELVNYIDKGSYEEHEFRIQKDINDNNENFTSEKKSIDWQSIRIIYEENTKINFD